MKTILYVLFASIVSVNLLHAAEPAVFDTKWIPSKPEMLTYTSTSPQGDDYSSNVEPRMGRITPEVHASGVT
jgi:hypothetical protein